MSRPMTPQSVGRVRRRVARGHQVPQGLDDALVERCVTAWIAAYEHIAKWRARGKAGRAQFAGESVDELLADRGIHFEFGPTPSLYRLYEEEVVRRAYTRMGIMRPGAAEIADTDDVVELYERGYSVGYIAQHLAMGNNAVHTRLRKAGVKMREKNNRSRRNRAA